MANGVTTLGGGWDQVPAAPVGAEFGERALSELLAQRPELTGEDLVTALKALGYEARGPAYYPAGPYYALGAPHNYAALSDARTAWDLHVLEGFAPTAGGRLPSAPPPPPPRPTPPVPLPPELKQLLEDVANSFTMLAATFREIAALVP